MPLSASRNRTMVLEPPDAAPVAARSVHASTVILEPAAATPLEPAARRGTPFVEPGDLEEAAPLTVMRSALEAQALADEAAPATRAPFQLSKPRSQPPGAGIDIPGAPWASTSAPQVRPVRDQSQSTLDPDDHVHALALRDQLAAFARERAEATDKPADASQQAPKTDPGATGRRTRRRPRARRPRRRPRSASRRPA